MAKTRISGREIEAAEIVTFRRAAEVGRLLLGELDGPLAQISTADYLAKSRADIRRERSAVRANLRGEIQKFCRKNFVAVASEDLAALYEPLLKHGSQYRLSLKEFVQLVGEPRPGILKGAPTHATISLSPWGLQTEYPEMHLARDLALSYNDMLGSHTQLQKHERLSWRSAKTGEVRDELASLLRRRAYSMRMALLSCFNLAEAYINGIAWEFAEQSDLSSMSQRRRRLLTEGQASLLEKLAKVPGIVKGGEDGPLALDEPPLSEFRDIVKPFRDSIVHASPFSTPERFGGYDKLDKVHDLKVETVQAGAILLFTIIETINQYLRGTSDPPNWLPRFGKGGRLQTD